MSECVVRMDMPTKDKACGMVFDFDGIWYSLYCFHWRCGGMDLDGSY